MDPVSMFFLWLLFGRCGGSGAAPAPAGMPGGEPGWPGSPISYTPPWPQAVPTDGLPKFPGSGWEFDEPPPKAVQQRAGQLVDILWKQGANAFRTEQTAGRWITYQAQIVASGKKGVVAYRLKRSTPAQLPPQTTASRPPASTSSRPPAPTSSRPHAPAPSLSSTPAPSTPQATSAPATAQPAVVRPGSPVALPVLVRGAGIKPKPPSPNVKLLQQRLGIAADGQFGGGTETAVKAFQKAHGLDVDGIVGPQTWTALFATGTA